MSHFVSPRAAWVACALLAIVTSRPASAADRDVAEYRMLRDQLAALDFASTNDLESEIALLGARTVELRGRIAGEISGPDGKHFIFKPEAGATLLIRDLRDSIALRHGHPARILFWVPVDDPALEAMVPLGFVWETLIAPVEAAEFEEAERLMKEWEERIAGATVPTMPHYRESSGLGADHLAALIRQFNTRLTQSDAEAIADSILRHSRRYQVNELLACSLVAQESRFNRWAVSRSGAQGLGQLMPGTARSLGVRNSFDPDENLRGAMQYLSRQLDRFGDPILALAAYNAGPGAVQRFKGVPPYRETRDYVTKVWQTFHQLWRQSGS